MITAGMTWKQVAEEMILEAEIRNSDDLVGLLKSVEDVCQDGALTGICNKIRSALCQCWREKLCGNEYNFSEA
jgi:hypothetical protein